MSIYSTASVARVDAERLIRLLDPGRLSNKVLEDLLFRLLGDASLHNFWICSADHHQGSRQDSSPGGYATETDLMRWLEERYKEGPH